MPDFSKWRMTSGKIDAESRAVDAWNRIQRDTTSVTIVRDGASLAVQTVRVEHDSRPQTRESDAGKSGRLEATILGVRSHPDVNVDDTDIEPGDRLAIGGVLYRVERTITPPGEVQAFAESV